MGQDMKDADKIVRAMKMMRLSGCDDSNAENYNLMKVVKNDDS